MYSIKHICDTEYEKSNMVETTCFFITFIEEKSIYFCPSNRFVWAKTKLFIALIPEDPLFHEFKSNHITQGDAI